MGIKNLWQLLSPVGRSVSIETLSGKTLAVDVSIWLTQFIKAMRDDEGKVVKNAHVIGTLRRVVKLLFHRIRPVFVFDGGAPALKSRTLAARRKLRSEGTDSSVRKTAQRILASQLKKHKAAMTIAKRTQSTATADTFNPVYQSSENDMNVPGDSGSAGVLKRSGGSKTNEVPLAAVAEAGEEQTHAVGVGETDGSDDEDDVDWVDEEVGAGDGKGSPAPGGHTVVDSDGDEVWQDADTPAARRNAPTAGVARAAGGGASGEPGDSDGADAAVVDSDEDEEGGWEEVDLPDRNEDIDPEVMASLPGHVKKQVIEAAKRRQRMRSRSQYMPVAGDPAMYSQTQLSNFLRSQKLNSQIMRAHKSDDGDRAGKRIASEADRRYIMTSAETKRDAKAAGKVSAAGGPASTGGGRTGSSTVANSGKRRRRITDEGDEFEEWSYDRPASPTVGPESRDGRTAIAKGSARRAHGGDYNLEEDDDSDDEEAGGFLRGSEDDDDEAVAMAEPRNSRLPGVRIHGDDGVEVLDRSSSLGDDLSDDAEGGFLPTVDEEGVDGSSKAVLSRTRGKGKGKGKRNDIVKRPAPISADSPDSVGRSPGSRASSKGKGKGKGKERLQRLADAFGDDVEEGDSGDQIPDGSSAADAAARVFQEEEDREAALALQGTITPSSTAAASGEGLVGGDKAGRVGHTRKPQPGRSQSSGGTHATRENGREVVEMRNSHNGSTVPNVVPGKSEGGGQSGGGGGGGDDGDDGFELEIDLKDLVAGGRRSALASLFPSEPDELESMAGGVEAGDDSDENFDGFVDDDGEHGPEDPSQDPGTSETNEAALQRSVDMASRMAGWAGRVVERVLKEHRQSGAPVSSHQRASAASSAGTSSRAIARTNSNGASRFGSRSASASSSSVSNRAGSFTPRKSEPTEELEELEEREERRQSDTRTTRPRSSSSEEDPARRQASVGRRWTTTAAVKAHDLANHVMKGPDETITSPAVEFAPSEHMTADTSPVASGKVAEQSVLPGSDTTSRKTTEEVVEGATSASIQNADPQKSPDGGSTSVGINLDFSTKNTLSLATIAMDADQGRDEEVSESRQDPIGEHPVSERSATESTKEREASPESEARAVGSKPVSSSSPLLSRPASGISREEVKEISPPCSPPATEKEEAVVSDNRDERIEPEATDMEDFSISVPSKAVQSFPDQERGPSAVTDENDHVASDTALFQPADEARDDDTFAIKVGPGAGPPAAEARIGRNLSKVEEIDEGGFAGEMGSMSYLGEMDEDELGREADRLKRERNRAQRDAETVTDEMKEEVMDLLKLFGVPFVVAPMEAEAQCCELERLRLVDGTVTDDSDAFAFGGKAVYKNIFNERKFVEAYLLPDADKDLGVSTDEMIALALLLGSDYTEGVRGVGIVNAMEIIHAFPLEGKGAHHGLTKFKKWLDGFDPLLDQELERLTKSGSKADLDDLSLEMRFHLKHRTARNRWAVSEGFPSKEVINAYKNPQVDKSEEPFSWAEPDIDGLRALCQRVLGWDKVQSDGLLMPMVKELGQGNFSQPRIDRYFMTYHDNKRVAAIKSKRLRTAVEDLATGPSQVVTVRGSAASTAAIGDKRKTDKTARKPRLPVGTGTRFAKSRQNGKQKSAGAMGTDDRPGEFSNNDSESGDDEDMPPSSSTGAVTQEDDSEFLREPAGRAARSKRARSFSGEEEARAEATTGRRSKRGKQKPEGARPDATQQVDESPAAAGQALSVADTHVTHQGKDRRAGQERFASAGDQRRSTRRRATVNESRATLENVHLAVGTTGVEASVNGEDDNMEGDEDDDGDYVEASDSNDSDENFELSRSGGRMVRAKRRGK